MGIVLENGFIDEMRNFLQQLWDADTHDYAYMWDDYEKIKEELVCRLAKDVNIAIAFLDALDFNDEVDQHIITCIPTITSRLGRFGAQFLFISHLVSLQKNSQTYTLKVLFVGRSCLVISQVAKTQPMMVRQTKMCPSVTAYKSI